MKSKSKSRFKKAEKLFEVEDRCGVTNNQIPNKMVVKTDTCAYTEYKIYPGCPPYICAPSFAKSCPWKTESDNSGIFGKRACSLHKDRGRMRRPNAASPVKKQNVLEKCEPPTKHSCFFVEKSPPPWYSKKMLLQVSPRPFCSAPQCFFDPPYEKRREKEEIARK